MTENTVTTINSKTPLVVLRERLEARKEELRSALLDIRPEQFIRAVVTAAQENPELQACSWTSLWQACMRACRDDLLPDGRQGVIVPYREKATWIPMYRGLITRAQRTGQISKIAANVVRDGEPWSHYIDETGEHFRHEPGDDIKAPILRIYAAAWLLNGGLYLAVMPKSEADKVRAMARATREDSPWQKWPDEMYKKTALRRLSKYLPMEIPIDDDEPYETPTEAAKPLPPSRRMGAVAALDAFAGQKDASAALMETIENAESDLAPGELAALAADETDSPPFASPESDEQRAKRRAYVRGKDAKSQGIARKAVPTEYRNDNKLALAWVLGWSGEQYPAETSNEPEST